MGCSQAAGQRLCLTGRMDCLAGLDDSTLKPKPCLPEDPLKSAQPLAYIKDLKMPRTAKELYQGGHMFDQRRPLFVQRAKTVYRRIRDFEADAAEAFAQDELIFE